MRVALLDTGVAPVEGAFARLTAFTPTGQSADPADYEGHGTACASLIASASDAAPGIAPEAELISIKVSAGGDPEEGHVLAAFKTALAQACNIISCSFTLRSPSDATLDMIRHASNAGIVIVAASGDQPGVASGFPERTPNVLVVGAYDHARHAVLGRSGQFTDFYAPGQDLVVLSTDGTPAAFGESSGASAVASGVVALVLSACGGKSLPSVALTLDGLAKATARLGPGGERCLDPARLMSAALSISDKQYPPSARRYADIPPRPPRKKDPGS